MDHPSRIAHRKPVHPAGPETPEPKLLRLAEVERAHIEKVLALCDGNLTQAAKLLQVNRRTLQRKLTRWSAEVNERSRPGR